MLSKDESEFYVQFGASNRYHDLTVPQFKDFIEGVYKHPTLAADYKIWQAALAHRDAAKPSEPGSGELVRRLKNLGRDASEGAYRFIVSLASALESQLAALEAKLREAELVRDQAIKLTSLRIIENGAMSWFGGLRYDCTVNPELAKHLASLANPPTAQPGKEKE